MADLSRLLRKTAALLLVPLALFAGSASAVDLMRCRAQGVVSTGCCCPAPKLQLPVDEQQRLKQGCCEGFTLVYSSEAPAPSSYVALVPMSAARSSERPVPALEIVDDTVDDVPRAERIPDATGPPLRKLHCSYLI